LLNLFSVFAESVEQPHFMLAVALLFMNGRLPGTLCNDATQAQPLLNGNG